MKKAILILISLFSSLIITQKANAATFDYSESDPFYYIIGPTNYAGYITINLTNIPTNANYDLFLYKSPKDMGTDSYTDKHVASSTSGGSSDEYISYYSSSINQIYFIRI